MIARILYDGQPGDKDFVFSATNPADNISVYPVWGGIHLVWYRHNPEEHALAHSRDQASQIPNCGLVRLLQNCAWKPTAVRIQL